MSDLFENIDEMKCEANVCGAQITSNMNSKSKLIDRFCYKQFLIFLNDTNRETGLSYIQLYLKLN